MQLILILALLLLGSPSSGNPQNKGLSELFEPETVELLKEISGGGTEVDAFMKEVEQISEIVSVLAPLSQVSGREAAAAASQRGSAEEFPAASDKTAEISRILKPVADIADDRVYNALARSV